MTGNKAMFITVFLEVRLTDDRIDSVQGGGGDYSLVRASAFSTVTSSYNSYKNQRNSYSLFCNNC